jgi:hypothetical protein
MKSANICFLIALTMLLSLREQTVAQGLPYTEGTVWAVSFIRIKPGLDNDYLRNLSAGWKKVIEEAKKGGLILSYKILSGAAANREDWDMMLMIEYKNMAALDGIDEKFEAINKKVMGSEEQQKAGSVERAELREISGGKLLRELFLK